MKKNKITKKTVARNQIEYKDVSLQEFLGLSDAENDVIEMKYKLARALQVERKAEGVTEKELATRMRTHQPAVNRMLNEAGRVSLDTIFAGFFALGKGPKEIAKLIADGATSPRIEVTGAVKNIRKRYRKTLDRLA